MFTLAPGIYTLDALSEMDLTADYAIPGSYSEAGVSLSADFTAIPEPFWTPILPASLVVLWHWAFLRRRKGTDSRKHIQ